MAVGADHILLGVGTAADVGARHRLAVATKARIKRFFRAELGECDDGRLAAVRIQMSLARSVAALATGVFFGFLAGSEALEMRVLVERREDVGVAGLTSLASDVIG